jgi:hypothetical protein
MSIHFIEKQVGCGPFGRDAAVEVDYKQRGHKISARRASFLQMIDFDVVVTLSI